MARYSYYVFPDSTSEEILLKHGCAVILKNGDTCHPGTIPDDKRELVDHIDHICGPCKISTVKALMKKYGGTGYTEHYERDGSLFEVSNIELTGNNSRFKYNRHL